ncbi:TnpV protein [Paenibacillus lactis]|uniref:TnpV protein n=2 Tax=Paenibacillus TaxID=44249 RepID=UPI001ABF95C2|nr:TnpV protein [Paenibacillus lactis]
MKLNDCQKGRMNMEVTYTRQGGYLLPDLTLTEDHQLIGKYGMLRKNYLKTEKKGTYASLLLSGELHQHLTEIDRSARTQLEQTMNELLRLHPAPDKASDPLGWTGYMNSLKQQVEETILTELIYN